MLPRLSLRRARSSRCCMCAYYVHQGSVLSCRRGLQGSGSGVNSSTLFQTFSVCFTKKYFLPKPHS